MDPLSYFGLPSLVLEIGLRLPPLYLMDLILLRDWGLKPFEDPGAVDEHGRSIYLHTVVLDNAGPDNATPIGANGTYSLGTNETALLLSHLSDWTVVPYLVNFFLCLLVYVGCLFLITLSPRQLGLFYAYVVSALCLPTSYASHKLMIEARELELQGLADEGLEPQSSPFLSTPLTTLPWLGALSLSTQTMLCNYVIQTSLGLVLGNVLKFHFSTFDVLVRVLTLSMVSPNFFATLGK